MSANSSPKGEALNPRNKDQTHHSEPSAELRDDFALVQLDTRFVALLSEISAVESEHGREFGALGRQHPESGRTDEAQPTQTIESILSRLQPVERAIMATPARTIVGLGIKARHAAYVVSEHWDAPIEQIDWDARAVRLLIEAVCKVAGVRLPFTNEADL